MSGAVAALALAQEAGVRLRVDEGKLKVIGRPETVPAEVLATLRLHKAEVLELLTGRRCWHCSRVLDWREPGVAIAFADATGACVRCYEEAEVARLLEAGRRVTKDVVTINDNGELVTREDEP